MTNWSGERLDRYGAGFAQAEADYLEREDVADLVNNFRPGTPEYEGYEDAAYIFTQK